MSEFCQLTENVLSEVVTVDLNVLGSVIVTDVEELGSSWVGKEVPSVLKNRCKSHGTTFIESEKVDREPAHKSSVKV